MKKMIRADAAAGFPGEPSAPCRGGAARATSGLDFQSNTPTGKNGRHNRVTSFPAQKIKLKVLLIQK